MPENIHGKQYLTVAERMRSLRTDHPDWSVITNVLQFEQVGAMVRAEISNEEGRIIASGHCSERHEAGHMINDHNYLENCETGAVGRALANAGYLGDELEVPQFASANEVANAISKRPTPVEQPAPAAQPVEMGDLPEIEAWQDVRIHYGKNGPTGENSDDGQGMRLGDLGEKSRQWYLENHRPGMFKDKETKEWKPSKYPPSEDDLKLRAALEAWQSESIPF